MPLPTTRSATPQDISLLASILADGFHDDPPMTWSFNGSQAIEPAMRLFAQYLYLPDGFGMLSEPHNGAALWLTHERPYKLSPLNTAKVAAVLVRYGGLRAVQRSIRFSHYMENHHPTEPHFYLFAIATTTAARGKGVGGALLKAGLAKADAAGVGCYLENSKPENLGFYQTHGFTVLEKVCPVKGSPPIWRMWRPARVGNT